MRLVTPVRHRDNRGFLSEVFNLRGLRDAGITDDFVQENARIHRRLFDGNQRSGTCGFAGTLDGAAQSGRNTDRIVQLNSKVENLSVIVRALCSLLEEQGITGEQLMDRIETIHAEIEHERNGGIPEAVSCDNSDSMVARGLSNCQICGERMPDNLPDPLAI